ncbi:hypothetical protein ACP4OV_016764 [Aristida adscensionis]
MAALLPVKPLDGADGYLRWKESMLLRLHTVGVAHVLSQDPPSRGRATTPCAAATSHLLPDYVHHATGRAVWEAVARTYDVSISRDIMSTRCAAWRRFVEFEFDDGAPLLEQLAHAEALGAAGFGNMNLVAIMCDGKLPEDVAVHLSFDSDGEGVTMDKIWKVARLKEAIRLSREEEELQRKAAMAEDQEETRDCWNCGKPGHIARNCKA